MTMERQARTGFFAGLMNWTACIKALVVRDIKTRFSGGTLGYGWAVIIPVAWIIAIATFFHWIGRQSPIATDLPVFVATGMLPYLVFRQVISTMMRVCRNERHLLTLGPSEPEDLFTAAGISEAINMVLVIAVIAALMTAVSVVPMPGDPMGVVAALALGWALGLAVGRLAAVAAAISDFAQRLVPILLRPFFWISGIFFVAAELPPEIAQYLWWNPLLHVVELLRSAYFGNFDSQIADPIVPVVAIFVCYLSSRMLERSSLVGDSGLVRL